MQNVLEVKCPCCNTILIVDKRSGKVLEERRPILEQSTGDRYQDALKKVQQRRTLAEEKFRQVKESHKSKQERLDALFKEKLKEISESGDESRPVSPFDFD